MPWTSKTRTTATVTDFVETFRVIDSSLPGLHEWVDKQLAERD